MKKVALYFFVILLSSCLRDNYSISIFDLPKPDNLTPTNIVIHGIITNELKYQSVTLKTSAIFPETEFKVIENAEVSVIVNGIEYPYIESTNHPNIPDSLQRRGTYYSVEKIQGMIGKPHTLHVKYNNIEYIATDTMKAVTKFEFDHFNIPIVVTYNSEHVQFGGVNFMQKENYFITWNVRNFLRPINDTTYTTARDEINSYFFKDYTNPEIANNSMWDIRFLTYDPDMDSLVYIKKHSISNQYKDFLIQGFQEALHNDTRFAAVPSNVSTNVSNNGYGYFAACAVDSFQIVFKDLYELASQKEY